MNDIEKQQLINELEGYANSIREGWMQPEDVYGNLMIILESAGFLKLKEEHYIRDIEKEQ
jgi:hypothetical protein